MNVVALARPIGTVINAMVKIREVRAKLAKQDADLKAEYDAYERELVDALSAQGTVQGSSKTHTASVSQSEVFTIKDFDAWVKFANKHKLTHAFTKQVSAPSIREYVALKGKVPDGLEPFTKTKVSLTARS